MTVTYETPYIDTDPTMATNSDHLVPSQAAVATALATKESILTFFGPLSRSGNIISITDAFADGATKGVAAFTIADFNASAGIISLDYANAQKASASVPGFLSTADWTAFNGKGNGTVTTASVVSTNGFAGSVANATTTPAITISTTITGLLKGNGTAISAASAGTDYEVPLTFSTGLTRSTNTITVNTSQNISTLSNLTSNGLIKTSGSTGALSIASAGTDYQVPITLTTTGTSGAATFSAGTLNIPNYAGSGVTTMAAIGATPNANGASISGSTLTLQPASGSFGGVVTTGTQTFAGAKTLTSNLSLSGVSSALLMDSDIQVNTSDHGMYAGLSGVRIKMIGSQTAVNGWWFTTDTNFTGSSVNRNLIDIKNTSQFSAGTNTVSYILIDPTINHTSTNTTTLRGIYYNPTLTSLIGTTHIAYQNTSGNVLLGTTSGSVGMGGISAPLTTLDNGGGIGLNIVTKTTTYTATASDHTILGDATSAGFTITLPSAASSTRRIYVIKKIDSSGNTVTIQGNGAETIDGTNTKTISTQYNFFMIQSDGTSWNIISS